LDGTWSPSSINTGATGTSSYTFTPADPCGEPVTIQITITDQATPTFPSFGPYCLNSTAPSLPSTSDNGLDGSWSPSSINTGATGTSSYTFTPVDPCGEPVTIQISSNSQVTHTFP